MTYNPIDTNDDGVVDSNVNNAETTSSTGNFTQTNVQTGNITQANIQDGDFSGSLHVPQVDDLANASTTGANIVHVTGAGVSEQGLYRYDPQSSSWDPLGTQYSASAVTDPVDGETIRFVVSDTDPGNPPAGERYVWVDTSP